MRKVQPGFKLKYKIRYLSSEMLTNVLGFFTENFHTYLLYFHLLKNQKSRSISEKGVTIRKSFSIYNSKSLFFLQNLISGINLGSFFYNYTLPMILHEKLWPLFSCPKFCCIVLGFQFKFSKKRSGSTFLRALLIWKGEDHYHISKYLYQKRAS